MAATLLFSTLRGDLDEMLSSLSSFVMSEATTRYLASGGKTRTLDSLESEVEVREGVEHYVRVRRNGRTFSDVRQIPGAMPFGEVASILQVTRDALAGNPGFSGSPVIDFHVPAGEHRWFVAVNSVAYWLGIRGQVRIDPETGTLRQISWASDPLPAGAPVERLFRSVVFKPAEVGGRSFILPDVAVYLVLRSTARREIEWNETRFPSFQRYGAESLVKFPN